MHASAPPPPNSVEDAGSLVLRFGTAMGLTATAALACAVPASIRIARVLEGPDGAVAHVLVGLAAAALGPMLVMVVALRAAREGLRAFVGPGAGLRAYGVGLWLASLVVALALFGSALRRTTHQHALAGVTFACGAGAIALGSAIVCARVVGILRNAAPGTRRGLSTAIAAIAIAAIAWVGLAFLRAVSSDPASMAASGTVVDILAFVLAALLASRLSFASFASFAPRRALALVGPPVAVAVTALGLSALRDAPLRLAVEDRAPAFAPAVAFVKEP
jgi:hypothetical protein